MPPLKFYDKNFTFLLDLFGNSKDVGVFGPLLGPSRCPSPIVTNESNPTPTPIAPDIIPLRHTKPPRYRPDTPYNGITRSNMELHYYNELKCSWKPLLTENDWTTAVLMCVEHMYVMKIIVTTPTLAAKMDKTEKPIVTKPHLTTMQQIFYFISRCK